MCDVCYDQQTIIGADGRLKSCPACSTSAPTLAKAGAHAHTFNRAAPHTATQATAGRVGRYDPREAQTKLVGFNEFLRLNPHVYAAFESAALEMLNGGEGRVAAKKIIELMRGKVASTGDDYDLNNTWAPWLARKAILAHPQLAQVIETRASLADILLDAAKVEVSHA